MNKEKIQDFTNIYELSKTLRFELKPVGNTKQMLEENNVFEVDALIQKKYQLTKPWLDKLHREFIIDSLQDFKLTDLDDHRDCYKTVKKDKTKKTANTLIKEEKRLRKEIKKRFDETAIKYKRSYPFLKKNNIDILFSKEVFQLLDKKYATQEGISVVDPVTGEITSIFDDWKGFTGYFTKFHETRKNFYKDDGTSTAIATRIIDQNLKRFVDNLIIFQNILDEKEIDLSEIEDNFSIKKYDFFDIEFYNKCLLQDGIDFYNKILGGETKETGEKLRGVNEIINQYRQNNKGEKIPFLKPLDKQILSEKEKFIDEIESEEELMQMLRIFKKSANQKISNLSNVLNEFIVNNEEYNLQNTYISKEALNTIMHKWFLDAQFMQFQLVDVYKDNADKTAKYIKKEDSCKFPDFIRLSYLKELLNSSDSQTKLWKDRYDALLEEENNGWKQFLLILQNEFHTLFENTVVDEKGADIKIGYDIFFKKMTTLLDGDFEINQETKIIIKEFANSVLKIYQMGKYFALAKKRNWDDNYELSDFYTDPENGYLLFYENAYEEIVQVYNKLRNYLTKKPYSEEKWKLNFENSILADGWDKNKESDNSAIILRKDERYYLGLMKKGHTKLFDDRFAKDFATSISDVAYSKVIYKLLPGANKMLPKVFFSKSNIDFFAPTEDVLNIRNHSSHSKSGSPQKGFEKKEFSVSDCHILIDFFKDSLLKHKDWKYFDFNFSETSTYKDISEFYREVEQGGYKISFQNISADYIEEKNEAGELYLFQIHNKDWDLKDGKKKTGKKNLHTMYFESLFSEENASQNFPMKLNGQAELFFRPKTSKEKLGVKKDKNGKEVVDHKRYNKDKMLFHIPMTVNRGTGKPFYFNAQINDFLADNPEINVIGVDRGEKHIAYYSVINQNNEILDSGTLNTVNGIDYAKKLDKVASSREKSRKDWQDVEKIKDLKKGYISHVVHKLADLIIEHNAIIVFEDLNMRFKQIRGGIEKSAYQQLEKALIEKLNFLVNKNEIDPKKAGHLLRAYQLAAPVDSFKDMGKQTGIIFYTQASYTSQIDPLTGWRPNLYLKYSNAEKAKKDIINFSSIEFNDEKNRFEFTYDLQNFNNSRDFANKTIWTLCSSVERYRWNRKLNNSKGGYEHYENLTNEFKKLFIDNGIDIHIDIIGQIDSLETKGNEKFFKSFMYYWSLLCQIRNTNSNEATGENDNDFILSPVEPFFDSRKAEEFGKNLPKNGDDNGAYNIARKGLVILNKISQFAKENDSCEKLKWNDLFISHKDWDDFVQK